MIKSFSVNKNQSPISLQSNQFGHNCYFHQSFKIVKFCKNIKCTLSLCQKCLPIHIRQHNKEFKEIGKECIISFSEAYSDALLNLNKIIQEKAQDSTQKVFSLKTKLHEHIQSMFDSIHIKSGQTDGSNLKLIQQKCHKIQKGSLKALIFYYSEQEKLIKQNQMSYQSVFFEKIKESLPKLIQNINKEFNVFLGTQKKKQTKQYVQLKDREDPIALLKCKTKSQTYSEAFLPKERITLQENYSNSKLDKNLTGQDFAKILHQQRSRLQNVKNKNTLFAQSTHQTESNSSNKVMKSNALIQRNMSRSVDKIYGVKKLQKQQNQEDRPLQLNLNEMKKDQSQQKRISSNSTSKQKLQKIKKKYIGDYSSSKVNFESKQNNQRSNNKFFQQKKQTFNFETSVQRNKELCQRILSRQQIRLNIENRLSNKSINQKHIHNSLYEKQSYPEGKICNLPFSNKQNYASQKVTYKETARQNKQKQIKQEFTLNKYNHQQQQQKDKDSYKKYQLMSSIKKQVKVQQGQGIQRSQNKGYSSHPQTRSKQTSCFTVHIDESKQGHRNLNKNNNMKYISVNDVQKYHSNIEKDTEKLKEYSVQNSNKRNLHKESIYSDVKQRISLSEPNFIEYNRKQQSKNGKIVQTTSKGQSKRQKGEQNLNKKLFETNISKQNVSQSNHRYLYSSLQCNKRFNYLQDGSNQQN